MADNALSNLEPIPSDRVLSRPAPPPEENNESTWSKVSREVSVLSSGLASGFEKGAEASLHDPWGTGARLATAVGTGVALTLLSRGGELPVLLARSLGAGMTLSFAADVVKPERLAALSHVASDTWHSDANTKADVGVVSDQLGRFAFDTALMSVGALGGGLAKGAPFFSESGLFKSSLGRPYEVVTSGAYGATGKFDTAATDRMLPTVETFPPGPLTAPRYARILTAGTLALPLAEIQSADRLSWLRPNGKELSWQPSQGSISTRVEAQNFVDSFMAKDYHAALETSIGAKVLDRVELNANQKAQTVEVSASQLKNPETLRYHMSQIAKIGVFKWDQKSSGAEILDSRLRVNVPRTVVELESGKAKVALVDFVKTSDNVYQNGYKVDYPTTSVTGEKLTAEQLAEIETIRKSPEGQRVLAETALVAFEESIAHANQHITTGGDIISPTYARFSRDFSIERGTRAHFLNFLNMVTKEHPMREFLNEQEVPAILYDAGMPLPVIEQHYFFGGRHVAERTPLMSFLRDAEANKQYDFSGPQPEGPGED